MSTFEAISQLDSEGISFLQTSPESLAIDQGDNQGTASSPSYFYATFDGKFIKLSKFQIILVCAQVYANVEALSRKTSVFLS